MSVTLSVTEVGVAGWALSTRATASASLLPAAGSVQAALAAATADRQAPDGSMGEASSNLEGHSRSSELILHDRCQAIYHFPLAVEHYSHSSKNSMYHSSNQIGLGQLFESMFYVPFNRK